MAARSWRIMGFTALLTILIWAVGLLILNQRWFAFERPGPPPRELFPYGEMRVGVDASYPPFAVATADDLFGIDIDLGREIGKRIGIPVRFVNMGYDGLYDSLRADQVDVTISALLVDPTRTHDVRYTVAYFNAGQVLVSQTNSDLVEMSLLTPDDALAYEFGSEADIIARSWLRRIPVFETRPYELPVYALEAVRLGEAEGALVDATSARLYLRDHPDWQAAYSYVTESWYAAAVRVDRYPTWEAINRALQAMIEDGTIEIILQRWL